MNRKLFLSLLSTAPLIGFLFPKKKREILKIQYDNIFAEYGDVYVQFTNMEIVKFKEQFKFSEFLSIAKRYIKYPSAQIKNQDKCIFIKKLPTYPTIEDFSYIV